MDQETALPTGDIAAAGEQATTQATPATEVTQGEQPNTEGQEASAEGEQSAEQKEAAAKKEKSPEQREIERLRRRVDNLTRRRYELEAQRGQPEPQRQQQATPADDDEAVTLSRAELNRMVAEQAQQLAPAVKEQQAEIEHRQKVVASLAKQWGKEEFDAKAADLDDAMGGLVDRSGRTKPATDAIFASDDPKGVIEYLTDPDNADDAERIARLPAVRVGREIARIEAKLKDEKAKAKARPSNAARPIESVKGGGMPSGMPDPANTKAYIAWANAQERAVR